MRKVIDFIKWALTHVDPQTIPRGATLSLPVAECGAEPWHYLYGSVKVQTTRSTLDTYYKNYYNKFYDREEYDKITETWGNNDFATDCQGLLDAYFTFELDMITDINANANYENWCTKKGTISEITRPWVLGEAVFMQAKNDGKMTHVGWICGFDGNEPLVVEACGISYGVVVTRLSKRNFTHRGLMTNKFDYEVKNLEKARFEVTTPLRAGDAYAKMQEALNAAGYTDADGKQLEIDGKWGKKSQYAFEKLISDYRIDEAPLAKFADEQGNYSLLLVAT